VLLLGDVKWCEADEIRTAPRLGLWSLPIETAERAIKAGWAFADNAPIVARLRASDIGVCQSWHTPPAHACVDLDPLPRPPRAR
jgi:hypothetical protein